MQRCWPRRFGSAIRLSLPTPARGRRSSCSSSIPTDMSKRAPWSDSCPPVRHVVATAQTFDRFGLPPGTLRYIGFEQVKLGAQSVPVAFGVTDARELDRALVEERFPGVLERHSTVDGDLWILFDHSGQVLRSGIERADARKLCVTLERRYPEIRTVSVRVTRVYARDGHPIERSRRAPLHLIPYGSRRGRHYPRSQRPFRSANSRRPQSRHGHETQGAQSADSGGLWRWKPSAYARCNSPLVWRDC